MKRTAFTLVELLVVVAIIALLISILVPTLGQARASAKLRVCASNLRQIGVGITNYANMFNGVIPGYPARVSNDVAYNDFGVPNKDVATNQIWSGDPGKRPSASNIVHQRVGLGVLLDIKSASPELFFCPADPLHDQAEEIRKLTQMTESDRDNPIYSSYLYRQHDMIQGKALLGDLGDNKAARPNGAITEVRVEALAMDMQTSGFGANEHFQHEGTKVNILYQDTSVREQGNPKEDPDLLTHPGLPPAYVSAVTAGQIGIFTLPAALATDPSLLQRRFDDMFLRADISAVSDPQNAPLAP